MRDRKLSFTVRFALAILLLSVAAFAMDLYHYDVDSLTYLSTDIVIAGVSVDAAHKFTATVIEALHGSLRPGDRLKELSAFLVFFQPLKAGQRVILFLDSRPQPPSFLYPDAPKWPFAIPPSGVYLIDSYGHVHEYHQLNNPGAYVAEGYNYSFPSMRLTPPTKEQDLALPSLDEVKARIFASISSVKPMRSLLDKAAQPGDVLALMSLLNVRSKAFPVCGWRARDAIGGRIARQLRSLDDPEILLRIYPLAAASFGPTEFMCPVDGKWNKDFAAARVGYLVQTLSDGKRDASRRIAAADLLLALSAAHDNGHITDTAKPVPIDNAWLSSSATKIRAAARTIFDDNSGNEDLRGRCLHFLDLTQPDVVEDVRRVYKMTQSEQLRFEIEEVLLEVSDTLYHSVNPPGGPATSLVSTTSKSACATPDAGSIGFYARYHEQRDLSDQSRSDLSPEIPHFIIIDERTGLRSVVRFIRQLRLSATGEAEYWTELKRNSELPAGRYSLALECSREGEPVSTGYAVKLVVVDMPEGRKLSISGK